MFTTQNSNRLDLINNRDLDVLDLIYTRLQELISGKTASSYLDINSEGASEQIAALAAQVDKLARDFAELKNFSIKLAEGHLDIKPPGRYNYIAASVKALHSQLKHVTWQAQRVKEGDYSHSIDFMGEFSEAFNGMVEALAERTERMEYEIKANRETQIALAKSQQVFEFVLKNIDEMILVVSKNKVLFSNDTAKKEFGMIDFEHMNSEDLLFNTIVSYADNYSQISTIDYFDRNRNHWFQIKSIPISWLNQEKAFLQVISEITERKINEENLKTLANTDELTGTSSRRSGLAYLDSCLLNPNFHPISLCYLDINNLKDVNDLYGHAEGDVYIKAVAQAIKEATRKGDNVSRMGGDEFMIIFLNKKMHESEMVIKRIASRLSDIAFETGTKYAMGFSYGIEEINTASPKSAEEYIVLADLKMYAYKQQQKIGR